MEIKGDDIYIPAQDSYEIQTFIDGSILTIYRSSLARLYAGPAEHCAGSSHTGQRQCADPPENVRKPSVFCGQADRHGRADHPLRSAPCSSDRVWEASTSCRGITMSSPDIRAGVALLIAALSAEGKSTIHNIDQIDRGYQYIDERLREPGRRYQARVNHSMSPHKIIIITAPSGAGKTTIVKQLLGEMPHAGLFPFPLPPAPPREWRGAWTGLLLYDARRISSAAY